jgi:hypothetical protein
MFFLAGERFTFSFRDVKEKKVEVDDEKRPLEKQNAWKKSTRTKKRSAYKSAEQILRQAMEPTQQTQKIIDLSGPQVCLFFQALCFPITSD